MNKEVDEEFENIEDNYLLQCICTELKDNIQNAIKYIEIHKVEGFNWYREKIIEILKGSDKE